ncbi:MAG: hypothetical protein ACJAWS_001100 [Oleiphilaceae bacterium]|jgi:hypothetical protein
MILISKANSSLFIVLVLLLFSNSTFATLKLTAPVIDQWIQSQSAFVAWGKKNEQQLNSVDNVPQTQQIDEHQNPLNMSISSLIEPLKSADLYDSASKLVQQYQFSNLEQWADITIRITTAAAAIELENNPKAMDMSELETLQESSQLSSKQKLLITQAIQQNKAMAKQLIEHTTDSDKLAVTPFLTRIHSLMNKPY